MNILLAEDNRDLCKVLKAYFVKEGFNAFIAYNGQEALDIFMQQNIDIVVLDWMMPLVNGISACKEIKRISDVKVLILTAKSEIDDELMALDIGADEYIRKPFDPRVLIARIRKLLSVKSILTINNIKLDTKSGKIYKDNIDINATNIEFKLLHCLLINPGQILSREQLLNSVWGYDYVGTYRTIDTHIRRLRKKVGENIILTYKGRGYGIEKK